MKIEELNVSALNPARAISGEIAKDIGGFLRDKMFGGVVGNMLAQHDWKAVGAGLYAEVYANPKYDYVLKIFRSTDKAYARYINLVKVHNNSYFPVFKGKIMKIGEAYNVIRVEKLVPCSFQTYTDFFSKWGLWERAQWNKNAILDMDPELIEAFDLIKSLQHGFDLHKGNVMMRPNGQIVIIDPVVSFD